jgi:hypothetical protein
LTGFTGFFGLFLYSASFRMKLTESDQPLAEEVNLILPVYGICV